MKTTPSIRALFCLVIVAFAGAIGGSAATWWLMRKEFIEQAVTRRVEVMRDFVKLSPEQASEFETITRAAVFESLKLPRGDQAARNALRHHTRESVRKILTPEQLKTFNEFHHSLQTHPPTEP